MIAAAALTAGLGFAAPAGAGEVLTASYDISLAGIPVGRANIGAAIAGDRYKVDVGARMTGLVGAVTRGSGQASASGRIGGRAPASAGYALSATSNDGPRTIRVAIAGGAVQASEMNPPLDERPDRIPVAASHKRGVTDPVSALIMPTPQGAKGPLDPAGCNRTLPIFDGATRFDIVLSYKGVQTARTKGFEGPVLVCAARWVPYAGHRPTRETVKYMIENRDMEVWLAPVGGSRVLMPLRVSVRTMLGATVVQASDFAVQTTTGSVGPVRASAN
jgi:hypothetical protein